MKTHSHFAAAAAIATFTAVGLGGANASIGAPRLCSQDYVLNKSSGTGVPSYDSPPIEVVHQAGSYVDFVVRNSWTGLSSSNDIYVSFHDDNLGTSSCVKDSGLTSCESTQVLRAYCMKLVPITIVSVYVTDSSLTSGDDAQIPRCCVHGESSQPTTTVEAYEFEINCHPTCASPQGPVGGCGTRPPTDPKGVTPAPTTTEDAMTMPPSMAPTTSAPTRAPTKSPTNSPTPAPVTPAPTKQPTMAPTKSPTNSPTPAPVTPAPTKQPTASPTRAPTQAPVAALCPVVTMDFDDLPEFGFIHDEWWLTKGVRITAKSTSSSAFTPLPKTGGTTLADWNSGDWRKRYRPNNTWQPDNDNGGAARVFDTNKPNRNTLFGGIHNQSGCSTSSPNDGDKDLGSPNVNCPNGKGGPGQGDGGDPTKNKVSGVNPYANCPAKPINNVLVVQESQQETCPDDVAGGGTITFEFNPDILESIEIISATFLDVDDNESVKIQYWEASKTSSTNPQYSSNVPKTGDNGLIVYDTKEVPANTAIGKVTFLYSGSGCIAEITYRPKSCPSAASRGAISRARRLSSTQSSLRSGNASATFGN